MDRRTYLSGTGTLLATGLLAGCSGGDGTATGTLATSVSDQPGDIGDFESCVVTIAGVWVKPASGDSTPDTATNTTDDTAANTTSGDGEDEGRTYIEFDEAATADLTELQGEKSKLVGEQSIETGQYEFLQLDVTGVEATLADGSEATVDTPGEAPLKFNQSFEIRADERTHFIADFTPVQRGNGSYLIRPVASETTVRYSEATTGGGNETDA